MHLPKGQEVQQCVQTTAAVPEAVIFRHVSHRGDALQLRRTIATARFKKTSINAIAMGAEWSATWLGFMARSRLGLH
jgi:hypothetical protein